MNRKFLALGGLGLLAGLALGVFQAMHSRGAATETRGLFPPDKLEGYLADTRIGVREDGKGGRPVVAEAVTPFGIRPGQVSPTGYWALMSLRDRYPDADWITVYLAEDSAMAEASQWVGVAELRAGKVTVTGGIPTPAEIDSLARMGVRARRPTRADLRAVSAVFDSTGGLYAERRELSRTLRGAGAGRIDKSRFFTLDLETASLHAVAKRLGMDPRSLQSLVLEVTRFYWAKAGDPL